MKSLSIGLVLTMALIMIVLPVSTPIFASYYDTSTASFSVDVADFSTNVRAYYENNTSSSITLNYSKFYIYNWVSSGMDITLYLNDVYDGAGGHETPSYVYWETIEPGEYIYDYMSLGYTSYTKQPGGIVIVLQSVCLNGLCIAHGTWNISFWDDNSITSYSFS